MEKDRNRAAPDEATRRGEEQRELLRRLPLPRDIEDALSQLRTWTLEHGAALCPNGRPDTFGEGMRAAKKQVATILDACMKVTPL